jgi:hypothetical protein
VVSGPFPANGFICYLKKHAVSTLYIRLISGSGIEELRSREEEVIGHWSIVIRAGLLFTKLITGKKRSKPVI